MSYSRLRFGALTLAAPPGLFEDDEAPADCIAALTSTEPASLRLWRLDASDAPNLAALMAQLCGGASRVVTALGEAYAWPGLAADVEGAPRKTHYLFESQGAAIHGVTETPNELWNDYAPFLEATMLSLDIGARPEPSLPLFAGGAAPEVSPKPEVEDPVDAKKRRLDDTASATIDLIVALKFEEAEVLLRAIDSDIYGACALADAFEAALQRMPTELRIFERALLWARRAVPTAHTAMEAESNDAAIAEREARLQKCFRPAAR
jgi:hypothetical protein